jgi:UDP-3-O-[3-hydroxymyristoyl] glucosamine N-acyltransferase
MVWDLGLIFVENKAQMRFDKPVSVQWIADFTGAKMIGDTNQLCTGINEIHKVVPGDISFVDFEKYYDKCLYSPATVIIINKEVACPEGKTLLVLEDPFSAYVKIVRHFRPFEPAQQMISDSAQIGEATLVQPGVFIGNHVQIGKNCLIHPNVTIYDHTVIGNNVIIHAGVVLGADAFYFKRRKERSVQYDKLESCGRVIIGNDVEIGACCTIDKGVSGDTIVGDGTKLDNHIHIGHGAVIGKNCLFAAQVGIGGKAIIEDEVILWGQVGVSKDLVIGKGAVVNAQSGVPASLEGGQAYFGSPAVPAKEKMKELFWVKQIPEIWRKLSGKPG